jgi:two-component system, chemotaxis family, protein-glutamate methylesterase/glutaminase
VPLKQEKAHFLPAGRQGESLKIHRGREMVNHDIVVMGSSAGGIEALTQVLAGLPADVPAALFIVQHTAPDAPGLLDRVLSRGCALPVQNATNRLEIEHGHVYVAPPDHHLMVDRSFMYTTQGPHENRSRPAVDPLFRSAAVTHGPRVIGVILSGTLDDGASGLAAVKRCGGIAVVQDPQDAAYPDMPQNASDAVDVDHSVPLRDMAGLLSRLIAMPPGLSSSPPADLLTEVEIARTGFSEQQTIEPISDPASLACPECGGPIWKIRDPRVDRYRCRVGHAYTARAMTEEMSVATERSLWAAIQMMDQQARMLDRFAKDEQEKGRERRGASLSARARDSAEHARRLRDLLFARNRSPMPELQDAKKSGT